MKFSLFNLETMKYHLFRSLLLLSLMLAGCSSRGFQLPQPESPRRTPLKILAIGNSWSQDYFAYLPPILSSMNCDWMCTPRILSLDGATIGNHVEYFNESARYEYYCYDYTENRWCMESLSPRQVLSAEDWDLVVVQQQSSNAPYLETYQEQLPALMDSIRRYAPQCEVALVLTAARRDGNWANIPGVWNSICETVRRVARDFSIPTIIPVGTALELAANTELADSTLGPGLFSSDNLHLQEGIGRLTAGFCVAQWLFEYYQPGRVLQMSVAQCPLSPNKGFAMNHKMPHPHGEVLGITPENIELAKRCALSACKSPFELILAPETGQK